MTESEEIQERIAEFAAWIKTVRVSQDGWAQVVERTAIDTRYISEALKAGKIVAHIPVHLKKGKSYVSS